MKSRLYRLIVLVGMCSFFVISCNKAETKQEDKIEILDVIVDDEKKLSVEEEMPEDAYEQIMFLINEGDIEHLAVVLLDDGVDNQVYNQICQGDKEIFDIVMKDVLLYCDEFNDAETIVRLREKGFVSDENFEEYWLALDYNPKKNENLQKIDSYLLYEIERFMSKEINDENFLKELFGLEALDETLKTELEKRMQ